MSVLYPPDTPYAQEMVKHEAQGSTMGPGLRPYVYRRYPLMMHKAGRPENSLGKHVIVETCEVESENAEDLARHQGFMPTPLEAIEFLDAQRLEIAKLAAEIDYEKKHKLSPRAVAEVEAAQQAHHGHLASVPVTPITPRRKKKES